jgi:hypothetical protein
MGALILPVRRDKSKRTINAQIAYVEDQLSEGDRTIHQSPKLDLRCQDEVMSKGHSQSGTGCDVVEGDRSILVQRTVVRNTFLAEIPDLEGYWPSA